MKRTLVLSVALFAITACEQKPEGDPIVSAPLDGSAAEQVAKAEPSEPAEPKVASDCRKTEFEGVALTHCIADPARHRIAMVSSSSAGQPYGSLSAFAQTIDSNSVAFAMNGGMYGDDLKAVGYYVEKGERLSLLDRGDGEGNFYLKPNGVFFGGGGKWQVMGSNTFFNTVGDRPDFGTQSGPLLVIDGKLHPEIQDDGPSRATRNGVGVDASGKAHFVISDEPLSFGQLARYFRDELKVKQALYLDGQVSSLWDPATDRLDKGRVGPIIVVTKRNPQ